VVEDPDDDESELMLAVTAVPDAKKGERLIVVHRPLPVPVERLQQALTDGGCPNIWVPSVESFVFSAR
jgi:acyl-[acyl-carrier-protein]-phospholipid O-acyltransferase/long-chain-fatty-acid--[acyl-carrier-protein] ligase